LREEQTIWVTPLTINMRAKKSLGQNFLKSKAVLADIILASELKSSDTVLEIGPGKGVLTEALLGTGAKVVAVEKDDRLIPLLQEKFAKEISGGKLKLIHGDALEIDNWKLDINDYKVVANIPYYITGQIFRKFLTAQNKPELVVLMVQKEVAQRIVARNGKESLLSLSIKVYGVPKIIRIVSKTYFKPRPKVDSAILKIQNISKQFFSGKAAKKEGERNFFELIKLGFSSKRKILLGNLKKVDWKGKKTTKDVFQICGINEKARAEDLSLGEWKCLLEKAT